MQINISFYRDYLHTFVLMNHQLRSLFVVILNNEIICVETNLSAFHRAFDKIESGFKTYKQLIHKFKTERYFPLEIKDKIYYFQKVV